ncbi:glycosyltransferase [Bacillus timonensis]|nr:glycosyltransferase [Bacillus timonensis]
MTKLLYMLNYPGKGGTEKYVLDLISAVGPSQCVFVYSEEGPGIEHFKQLGIPTYKVNMKGPFDLAAAKALKEIIKKENVDVVHAQFLRENYIALLARFLGAKVKVVWTYHVDVPMNAVIRAFNRFFTRENEAIIAVSQFMKKQLTSKGVSNKKVQVIYNGIEDQFHSSRPLQDQAVLAVIGRLREEKGHAFLLKSLYKLQELHPHLPWVCHIYGEGPAYDELKGLIEELQLQGRVELKGFSSDKQTLYGESDLIIIPSQNESLSYVAIEALSFQKGVIATNVGGLPEVIKDRETGLLVQYGDIEKMAESIHELITNRETYEKLSKNGRDYFVQQFSLATMIEKTKKLYSF